MWTAKNRGRYDRSKLRYPSDLTDDEWAHVEPLIPPAKRSSDSSAMSRCAELNEADDVYFEYGMPVACDPKFAAAQHTFDYLDLWSYDGTLDRIHHPRFMWHVREQGEREASPTAAIVDSQSVKSAEKGGPASIRMAMTQQKGKGKDAIFSVDTLGLLLVVHAIIHPADIQDRDGGILLLATLFGMYPFLKKLFADGGYRGRTFKRPW